MFGRISGQNGKLGEKKISEIAISFRYHCHFLKNKKNNFFQSIERKREREKRPSSFPQRTIQENVGSSEGNKWGRWLRAVRTACIAAVESLAAVSNPFAL